MTENAITVQSVSKQFKIHHENTLFNRFLNHVHNKKDTDELTILKDVTFEVKKGEMFGIIGNNGVGKTTLLRLIAGIYKPDSGTIQTSGSMIPLLELGTGFNPEMSAVDNIIMYGKLLGFSDKQIRKRVHDILAFAELERFADVKIKTFSAGMYTRLSFSTSIQIDPDILLVDEILSVGDASFQKKSFDAFMSFHKKGKTVLYASHNLESIKNLCDRALFLQNGRIGHIGKPEEVIDAYTRTLSDT